VNPESVLFITLDSCRHDTFEAADAPNLKACGPVHRAQAPAHFTYGSHAAMFVGFTPGVAEQTRPFLNPKYARLFRLRHAGHSGFGQAGFVVDGDNIVDGFRRAGYATLGVAAMGWFNPETSISRVLRHGFEAFRFVGSEGIRLQIDWLEEQIAMAGDRPVFAFMNIGETHVPYHHEGAAWSAEDNPCVPFQTVDRSDDCRHRQRACLEYVDAQLGPLLRRFDQATVVICSDHGDCWGEDGLWEHGISHEKTLTVPLIIRYRGEPV
jgi:hypothetical protein